MGTDSKSKGEFWMFRFKSVRHGCVSKQIDRLHLIHGLYIRPCKNERLLTLSSRIFTVVIQILSIPPVSSFDFLFKISNLFNFMVKSNFLINLIIQIKI